MKKLICCTIFFSGLLQLSCTIAATHQSFKNRYYTIQVYSSVGPYYAKRFIRDNPQIHPLHIVHKQQGSKTLYKVVYGRYSTARQARYVLAHSHNNLTRLSPWVIRVNINHQTKYERPKKAKHAHRRPIVKPITFYMHDGSLFANIDRFSRQFKYQLIWNVLDPENDHKATYIWTGNDSISAKTPEKILQIVMSQYPVNVHIWKGNRVICVSTTGSC